MLNSPSKIYTKSSYYFIFLTSKQQSCEIYGSIYILMLYMHSSISLFIIFLNDRTNSS